MMSSSQGSRSSFAKLESAYFWGNTLIALELCLGVYHAILLLLLYANNALDSHDTNTVIFLIFQFITVIPAIVHTNHTIMLNIDALKHHHTVAHGCKPLFLTDFVSVTCWLYANVMSLIATCVYNIGSQVQVFTVVMLGLTIVVLGWAFEAFRAVRKVARLVTRAPGDATVPCHIYLA